ncbi:UvrD-helicase domain-containing protein [Shewanella aestuarii]|uniref:RecBCD enzyme subunit RecB n=1 Tax=Shewanella aestuarii TaxID=1028752 RepID=A0ABT0KYI2_9GAMM|nr:UvrD-helicase domain-containing protein [Shewanella aestuarii]MCL1116330.1 UvrD-helicase domain-containing protein [Shewanella aestuarii]
MNNAKPANITVSALDALHLPFSGTSLIEASAGTGKTYTISGLYLRLLLGHGGQAPLLCEQILVVTFTNAATEELRDRIRKRIQIAYKRFLGVVTQDHFIEQLYDDIPESEHAIGLKRLDLALKSLDEGAIFTIHGFCQRILADMAFESSLLFESEFTLDDSEYLHHAVRDFWREACYPLPLLLAQQISNTFGEPEKLAHKVRALLGASQATPSDTPEDFINLSESLIQSLQRFKLRWPVEQEATFALLNQLPLNGQRFGKKTDGYPKLQLLFDELTNWVSYGQGLPPQKPMEHLALSELKLNKGGEIPSAQDAPLLDHIERLAALIDEVIPAFLVRAQAGIKQRFIEQKQQRNLMTPDDLLTSLAKALENNADTLPSAIAKRFPIALIDEFQDTDPLQFQIFSTVYQTPDLSAITGHDVQNLSEQSEHQQSGGISALGMLMIGDPKQAIYAFRGADIFTYINARNQTQAHYNLDTNYRSSAQLVEGVNQLFKQHHDPFISAAIPYDAVKTPQSARNKILLEASEQTAALRIKLLKEDPESGLNKTSARQILANDTAAEITRLLTEAQSGLCSINGEPLIAKNIAVLVRDRNEAAVVKAALSARNIGAVFLSRDSVFDTTEAREIALILRALANPKDERAIRAALATELMGYNAIHIHQFNQDETLRQKVLDLFNHWHQLWLSNGIMPALLSLANDTRLVHRLLAKPTTSDDVSNNTAQPLAELASSTSDDDEFISISASGERRLTDFRHLGELLQQKATEVDGSSALINWFEQQLLGNQGQDEQQLRLESEQNLVQIVTIHKSKGLEYPICFVPFISLARGSNRRPEPMLYHNNGQLIWDIHGSDEGWEQYKREALAEDLRLLYVALTRPVYACYLYIANQSRMLKAGISSQLHETAIGYLLGITDKSCDGEQMAAKVAQLATIDAIGVENVADNIGTQVLSDNHDTQQTFVAKNSSRKLGLPWRVGSYSGLVKHLPHEKTAPGADDEDFSEEILAEISPITAQVLDRFSFERGANAGSFMHLVLELFDFTQAETALQPALIKAMQQYGFDQQLWLAPLMDWYQEILATPLIKPDLSQVCLQQLSPQHTLVEMEFYLPINQLQAAQLNSLLGQYGYANDFSFDTLKGMLKGFIDLTFEHQGQFFIADYKSNHLGHQLQDYNPNAMAQAINSHRYNLQYILYTLALHRYLRLRMPNYDYNQHIGGCFYLFLRGMSPNTVGSGVFFDKPDALLIEQLDALFSQAASDNHAIDVEMEQA